MTQWFIGRRGLALGLIITGASLGGVCLPLFTDALLKRFGVPWTMRIWVCMTAVLGVTALHFSRPRLPLVLNAPGAQPEFTSKTLLNAPFLIVVRILVIKQLTQALTVLLQALASFLHAAGYFPVSVFLPTQVSNLGISNPNICLYRPS